MFKKEKGITLVALVVTIVVLLILAGVSLSLVLSNQGIVTKANEGKTNYTNAAAEEKLELTNAEQYMDSL
jgi:flagellar basal body-associated protein FliL